MPFSYADTFVGVVDGTLIPAALADGRRVHAERRVISAVITLAGQASGTQIYIGKRPRGSTFLPGGLNTDTSLGTATVSIGSLSSGAKYKAAAVLTAIDTPTAFGKASAHGAAPSTDDEDLYLTVGTAALPVGGTLVVDFNYAVSH